MASHPRPRSNQARPGSDRAKSRLAIQVKQNDTVWIDSRSKLIFLRFTCWPKRLGERSKNYHGAMKISQNLERIGERPQIASAPAI